MVVFPTYPQGVARREPTALPDTASSGLDRRRPHQQFTDGVSCAATEKRMALTGAVSTTIRLAHGPLIVHGPLLAHAVTVAAAAAAAVAAAAPVGAVVAAAALSTSSFACDGGPTLAARCRVPTVTHADGVASRAVATPVTGVACSQAAVDARFAAFSCGVPAWLLFAHGHGLLQCTTVLVLHDLQSGAEETEKLKAEAPSHPWLWTL